MIIKNELEHLVFIEQIDASLTPLQPSLKAKIRF